MSDQVISMSDIQLISFCRYVKLQHLAFYAVCLTSLPEKYRSCHHFCLNVINVLKNHYFLLALGKVDQNACFRKLNFYLPQAINPYHMLTYTSKVLLVWQLQYKESSMASSIRNSRVHYLIIQDYQKLVQGN